MTNLVIVALPTEDDYVNQLSTEKVPHLTILSLGDVDKVQNLSTIAQYLEHAASRSLTRFGLEVDRRGTLGPDEADVLFFAKNKWSSVPELLDFRNFLLQDPNIRTAFDSSPQFDEFVPHLTMGYPDRPAKNDPRDYPGIHHVSFDRVALWVEDYAGPEFPLAAYNWDDEVMMSDTDIMAIGARGMQSILHYGTKGMRWGVRNGKGSPTAATVADKGKKLKGTGGKGAPAHEDAISARTLGQQGKASGVKTLSNAELKQYAERLRLEQEVKRLEGNEKPAVKKFIAGLLGGAAKQQATIAVNREIGEALKKK